VEDNYVLTNLILERVPPLPDNELNVEDFIGERNIIVPDICIKQHHIREFDLFPRTAKQSQLFKPVEKRAAYEMTPEYLAWEMENVK
jgi:hypothetical protein